MITRDRTSLLEAARAGDPAARERLVRLHMDTVRAVCGSRLRSPHDVADASQETFLRALSHLDQVRDADALDAWLRAIAVRVCADLGRQQLRSVCAADPAGDTAADEPGPSDLVLAHEEATLLHATLATLGARDRQALWLRDAVGLPVARVAADLGVTEGSARVLLTRARERLRAAYQGVAGVAAIGWLRLRGRFHDPSGIDLRVAMAAQLAIVAVAVGVAIPGAHPPIANDDDPATGIERYTDPAPDAVAVSVERELGADRPVVPGARSAPPAVADRTAAPDPAPDPAPVVSVTSERPSGPSRIGVAAGDGDGDVAGVELWGGPLPGGGPADGADDASQSSSDDEGDDGSVPLGPIEIVPGSVDPRD